MVVFSTHVLSEDTVYRQIRDGKLYSRRLLTKTNKVPKWGERFISSRIVKIMEESVVDPKNKTLTTYTRNLGYQSVMVSIRITYCNTKFSGFDVEMLENSGFVAVLIYLFLSALKISEVCIRSRRVLIHLSESRISKPDAHL